MIAGLFGVPPQKNDPKAVARARDSPVRTRENERVLNEKRLIVSAEESENYYPTRGVVTVGILMTIVGLLLFSPIKLPSIYRIVGGIGFFIMGISVIGGGLLNSKKNRGVKTK
jgi:hypothetical protein